MSVSCPSRRAPSTSPWRPLGGAWAAAGAPPAGFALLADAGALPPVGAGAPLLPDAALDGLGVDPVGKRDVAKAALRFLEHDDLVRGAAARGAPDGHVAELQHVAPGDLSAVHEVQQMVAVFADVEVLLLVLA